MRAVQAIVVLAFATTFLDVYALTGSSSHPQDRQRITSDDGRITGRVLTVSGEPLAGATVVANVIADPYRPAPQYTAITGSDGRYLLKGILRARVLLLADRPGYTYQKVEGDFLRTGTVIDLTGAKVVSGVDLVVYRTGFITGRVTRPDGTPVANARMMSQFRSSNGRLMGTTPPVMTDANGNYVIERVPPGTFRVSATYSLTNEMRQPLPAVYQDWARTFHPATTDFEYGTPVTVGEGELRQQVDITLQPQTRRPLTGLVVAENGQALNGVEMQYYAPGSGPFSTIVPVGAEGRFVAAGVAAPLTLLARGETNAGTLVGVMQLESTNSFENIVLLLGPAARVSGRLVFEGARAPRDPPMYVQLATEWPRPDGTDATADAARVDDEGRFHIGNVIGERRVRVIGLTPDWRVKELRRTGTLLHERLLVLHPGDVVDDLEILIAPR